MKFKLKPTYFTERIPLCIYRKGNTIYFQLQHEIVRADGYRAGTFCEYDKITAANVSEIGVTAKNMLDRFHEISDFTPSGLEEMLRENCNNPFALKNSRSDCEIIRGWDFDDLTCDACTIKYFIYKNKYTFNIWWHKKSCKYGISCDSSLGEKGILMFDTPLEFTDYSDTEMLGQMIVEALDRSRKISDKAAGNPYPEKTVELANGSKLNVSAPRDKHFTDNDDYGVGELYQAYMYLPREDSEEASAVFYIGMASELNGEIAEENILKALEKQYGKAETFTFSEVEYGMFRYRAEMKNKKIHRIAYFTYLEKTEDSLLPDTLDCVMELRKPNSRKKLDEKLMGLFEEFALGCSFKA